MKVSTVAIFERAFSRFRDHLKTVRDLTVKSRCKTLMPKKCTYTRSINRFRPRASRNVLLSSFSSVDTMSFPKCAGYRVPFSKSTAFKICHQKLCGFCMNGRPIRHISHRFQNVPAACESSLGSGKILICESMLCTRGRGGMTCGWTGVSTRISESYFLLITETKRFL